LCWKRVPIEISIILAYALAADEFVRLSCREYAGWRRDEWAHSPLFICGKFQGFSRSLKEKTALWRRNRARGERFLLAGVLGKMAVSLDAIRSAAARVATSHGLDLVDIELVGPSKERVLRVFLEKNAEGRALLKTALAAGAGDENLPERLVEEIQEGKLSPDRLEQLSGITHEDCAAFSRDFGVLLDVEDLVPGAEYTLEASSPGLDRKLTRPEEFQRFMGNLVKVQTFEPIRNNRHWQGRLTASTGEVITLDLNAVKQNSKSRKTGVSTVEIALANIEKAQLVPEI
jgi:ribosome maturation factor RimP